MLLPLAGMAAYLTFVLRNPAIAGHFVSMFMVSYVLSQGPYLIALLRSRGGPDRLAAAIAFASSCVFFVESLLPFFGASRTVSASLVGILFSNSLHLIGVVLVAVFSWQMGQLCPAEEDDLAVLGGSFIGAILYLVAIRYVDMNFLPYMFR
jgi:hypothetical protein